MYPYHKDMISCCMIYDKELSGMQKSNHSHTGINIMAVVIWREDHYVIFYPRGKDCHIRGGKTVTWDFPGKSFTLCFFRVEKLSCDILSGGKTVTSVKVGNCHMTFYPGEKSVPWCIFLGEGLTWEGISCDTGRVRCAACTGTCRGTTNIILCSKTLPKTRGHEVH